MPHVLEYRGVGVGVCWSWGSARLSPECEWLDDETRTFGELNLRWEVSIEYTSENAPLAPASRMETVRAALRQYFDCFGVQCGCAPALRDALTRDTTSP
jgi:hypothetical protein